jgi:hypothetical protein
MIIKDSTVHKISTLTTYFKSMIEGEKNRYFKLVLDRFIVERFTTIFFIPHSMKVAQHIGDT